MDIRPKNKKLQVIIPESNLEFKGSSLKYYLLRDKGTISWKLVGAAFDKRMLKGPNLYPKRGYSET